MADVLVSENMGGNWHQARAYINKHSLAPYVLQFSELVGNTTLVLFRMPEDLAIRLNDKGILFYKATP